MRIEQITFSRFLAAIAIVVFHYGKNVFPFSLESISFIFEEAAIGVSYFFILSGFVMIIAYGQKKEISTFIYFKNRFARIYPVYFLAIVILFIYKIIASNSIDTSGLILNIFLIQSWIPSKALSFNTPGWSLAVEFLFYALFPFLFNKLYRKYNYRKIAVPFILFFIISQVVFHWGVNSEFYGGVPSNSHSFLYYFPLMHLNEFLIGNLAGLLFIDKFKGKEINCDWLILIITFIIIILLKYDIGLYFHNGLMAILFVPLIFALSINKGLIARFSNLKIMVFLGEISYGIYILQKPIFSFVRGTLIYLNIDNNLIKFYLPLFALIIISAISYRFIESPLRVRIKNIQVNRIHKKLLRLSRFKNR